MIIQFKKLFEDVEIPAYATVGSAGFDLVAHNFKSLYYNGQNNSRKELELGVKGISLYPNTRILIGTGFSIAIPEGYMMDIRPRSGNALKQGLTVLNSPGTIDSDYRGEVGVILHNTSQDLVAVYKGDKIAQGVITEFIVAVFAEVEVLSKTERKGGFGSTDKISNEYHLH